MTEIKSTLDIIMEKTRGLSPTEEEKRAFREKETQEKIVGWVQKAFDHILSPERLRENLEKLDTDRAGEARAAVVHACIDRVDPEGDNDLAYALIRTGAGVDSATFEEEVSRCRERLKSGEAEQCREHLERLRARGISGSAVRANLYADPQWRERVEQENVRLKEVLHALYPSGDAE